jgi:hypothetical protein
VEGGDGIPAFRGKAVSERASVIRDVACVTARDVQSRCGVGGGWSISRWSPDHRAVVSRYTDHRTAWPSRGSACHSTIAAETCPVSDGMYVHHLFHGMVMPNNEDTCCEDVTNRLARHILRSKARNSLSVHCYFCPRHACRAVVKPEMQLTRCGQTPWKPSLSLNHGGDDSKIIHNNTSRQRVQRQKNTVKWTAHSFSTSGDSLPHHAPTCSSWCGQIRRMEYSLSMITLPSGFLVSTMCTRLSQCASSASGAVGELAEVGLEGPEEGDVGALPA